MYPCKILKARMRRKRGQMFKLVIACVVLIEIRVVQVGCI